MSTIQIKFDNEQKAYPLGEKLTGKLIVTAGDESLKADEIGFKLDYHAERKSERITESTLERNVTIPAGQTMEFPFSIFNWKHETGDGDKFDFKVRMTAFVERDSLLPIFNKNKVEQEITFLSDKPYRLKESSIKLGIGWFWLFPIIFGAIFAFDQSQEGSREIAVLLVVVVLGLIVYLLGNVLVGRLSFNLVPVDDNSFNIVAEDGGVWKYISKASIYYDVKGTVEKGSGKNRRTHTTKFFKSNKVEVTRETGMWANLKFPDPPLVPPTFGTKHSDMNIRWSVWVKVRTSFMIPYTYSSNIEVFRAGQPNGEF